MQAPHLNGKYHNYTLLDIFLSIVAFCHIEEPYVYNGENRNHYDANTVITNQLIPYFDVKVI